VATDRAITMIRIKANAFLFTGVTIHVS
jgi:hypothetical protein